MNVRARLKARRLRAEQRAARLCGEGIHEVPPLRLAAPGEATACLRCGALLTLRLDAGADRSTLGGIFRICAP